jgi:dTDP-4-amino-4,6-dideoxygalactose transaminase
MSADAISEDAVREELEREIANYIGTRYAILCSSGRTAIMLSLSALGIGHKNGVVIPDFACQIVPITVFCAGAVPQFCDIDRQTLTLSPTHLKKVLKPHTKAVIFITPFGLPVDPSSILEIADEQGIVFIDDAAQAVGTEVKGKKAGSFGDLGILTFNKSLNVDLGAAITTNQEELSTKMKSLRRKYESRSFFATIGYKVADFSHLKSRRITKKIFQGDKYLQKLTKITFTRKHVKVVNDWIEGNPQVLELWRSNALTTNITNQLLSYGRTYSHKRKMIKTEILNLKDEFEKLENYLQKRREIAKMYNELVMENGLSKIVVPTDSAGSYIRYPVLFSGKNRLSDCIKNLARASFHIDGRYKPLHLSPLFDYATKSSDFKESIYVSEHILPLPVKNLNADYKKAKKVVSIVNHNRFK